MLFRSIHILDFSVQPLCSLCLCGYRNARYNNHRGTRTQRLHREDFATFANSSRIRHPGYSLSLSRLQKHQSLVKPRHWNALFIRRSIMKKTFHLLLSTFLLVSMSTPLLADTIRLKDGSVIRGQVIGFKDQQFTILSGGSPRGRRGQTTVYVEDVESIEFDANSGNTAATDDGSARNNVPLSRPSNPPITQRDNTPVDRTVDTVPASSSTPTFFTIN